MTINDNQLEELTEIGNIKQEVPISKVTRTNDVAVQIEGAISKYCLLSSIIVISVVPSVIPIP